MENKYLKKIKISSNLHNYDFKKNLLIFLIFIFVSLFFLEKIYKINPAFPSRHGDDAAYFNTAFNINKYGVASHQIEEFRVYKHKNVIKPPLYSFVLSLFMDTKGKFEKVNLNCIYKKDVKQICTEFIINCKRINYYIHFFHVVLIYLLIFLITKKHYLGFIGGFLILSSTYYLNSINYFMTESFSSIIFLIHSSTFYLFFSTKKFKVFLISLSALSLGFLILTKAVFIYWFYIILILFLFFNLTKKLLVFNKINPNYFLYFFKINYMVTFFSIIIILITPWQFRNFLDKGEFKISLQGGNVIAERAEYLKTEYEDIKYGIIYYIPSKFIKNKFKEGLEKNSYMFDEGHLNSHYNNSDDPEKSYVLSQLSWKEKDNSSKIFKKSLSLIISEPLKHFYLSIMFFVRGIFLETQVSEYHSVLKIISSIVHWSSIIIIPILFFYFLIKLDNKVFLLLPSLFLIFTYSFFTDFEPRYGSLVTSTYLLIIIIHIKNIVYKQISYEK